MHFCRGKLELEKIKAYSHYRGNQHGSVPRFVNADEQICYFSCWVNEASLISELRWSPHITATALWGCTNLIVATLHSACRRQIHPEWPQQGVQDIYSGTGMAFNGLVYSVGSNPACSISNVADSLQDFRQSHRT